MSLHSSLKVDKAGATVRTVLTRVERIKDLIKKGEWSEKNCVTSLPKTKVVRIKAGKKKVKEEASTGKDAKPSATKDAKAPAKK